MTNLNNKIAELNDNLSFYVIEPSDFAIGEDGEYIRGANGESVGYCVRNVETDIVEHTSMLLPAIIFQAEHLDSMLTSLINKEEPSAQLAEMPVDDVVPN